MTANQLPDSDKDLKLARQIGSALQTGSDLSEISDPLVDQLVSYKEERTSYRKTDAVDAQLLWEKIASTTGKDATADSSTTAKVFPLFSRYKSVWAAAAAVLLAALIGIFYYTSQPQLLAESGGQITTVTLDDGSSATLRPHSRIYLVSNSAQELAYRLQGEAFFEITKRDDQIFRVEAGTGEVRVLGTRFNLSSWGEQTQVYLEEGTIAFRNRSTDQAVQLEPGQSAEIQAGRLLERTEATEVDPSEFTDWMNRELIFNNRPAAYIFSEMEQEFDISIEAPQAVRNTTLSGGLSLESLDRSLEDLGLVLNGQFVKTGRNTYKFESNR